MQGRAGFRLCSSSLLRQRISLRRSCRRRSPPPFAANRAYRVTHPRPHLHLHRDGLLSATSAPGLGSPRPHLRRDWAHPALICTCTGTGSCPKSAPGLGRIPAHICAGTGLAPPTGLTLRAMPAATSAPGLPMCLPSWDSEDAARSAAGSQLQILYRAAGLPHHRYGRQRAVRGLGERERDGRDELPRLPGLGRGQHGVCHAGLSAKPTYPTCRTLPAPTWLPAGSRLAPPRSRLASPRSRLAPYCSHLAPPPRRPAPTSRSVVSPKAAVLSVSRLASAPA
jgi:hypothetical protein